MRIAIVCACFMLVPFIANTAMDISGAYEAWKGVIFLALFLIFPVLTIAVAVWDGVKEGFSLLWLIAPCACFIAPMYIFYNDSAFIYGVIYSVFGGIANGVTALIRRYVSRSRQSN